LEAQLGALHEQMQQLQSDNTTLQAKLKEALGRNRRQLTRVN